MALRHLVNTSAGNAVSVKTFELYRIHELFVAVLREKERKKKKVYQTTRKKVTSCRCARSGASPISDHPTRKMAEERKQKVSGFFQTSGEQSNSRDREIQNDFKRKSYRVVCLPSGRKNRDRGLRRSGEISYDFRGWKFWRTEKRNRKRRKIDKVINKYGNFRIQEYVISSKINNFQ